MSESFIMLGTRKNQVGAGLSSVCNSSLLSVSSVAILRIYRCRGRFCESRERRGAKPQVPGGDFDSHGAGRVGVRSGQMGEFLIHSGGWVEWPLD
jgi:hypothetical protein